LTDIYDPIELPAIIPRFHTIDMGKKSNTIIKNAIIKNAIIKSQETIINSRRSTYSVTRGSLSID